ncbi:MAG: hypothetical protein ACE14L_04840 [Terriglobales bacterium]
MTNPRKKRNARRRNPFAKAGRKHDSRRRRNPIVQHGRRRRRNPSLAVAGYKPVGILKLGAGAAAGAIATRAVTQLVLRDRNEGLMGYGANVLAALGLGYLASKVDAEFAAGVIAGGFGSTMQRIWNERVSLTSPAASPELKGMGDVDYSDNGLGEFVNANWPAVAVNGAYTALPAAGAAAAAPAAVPERLKARY